MTVIYQGIVGSHAYGLTRAGSDIDHLGVFLAPSTSFWGLRGPKETETHSGPEFTDDITVHELGKYCRLALQCNPTLLELLWLPESLIEIATSEARYLRHIRDAFLSERRVRDAFGGYAFQQAERLRRRNEDGKSGFSADTAKRTAKHARHCYRLLQQGRQLLETGSLVVAVEDPLQYWRFDDMAVDDIVSCFATEFQNFAAAKSVLPVAPNEALVNEFLVEVRRAWL